VGIYGDAFSDTVPAVGDAETGASQDVTDILTEVVGRLEDKVTPAGMDIDATFDVDSQLVTNVKGLAFTTQVASPGSEHLWTQADATGGGGFDELWFTNSNGDEVQISVDGALNVSATGVITGTGYGSAGVVVNWDSASDSYQLKNGAGADDFAKVRTADVDLHDASGFRHRLSPDTLTADRTFTLPDHNVTFASALPAAEIALSMDSSGNINVADTSTPLAAYKYTDTEYTVSMLAYSPASSSGWGNYAGAVDNTANSGTQNLFYGLTLPVGSRIDEVKVNVVTNNDNNDLSMTLYNGGSSLGSNNDTATGELSAAGIDHTVVTDSTYYVLFSYTATGTSNMILEDLVITLSQE